MKLSKVFYLNLEIHSQRDQNMQEWLKFVGVPKDQMHRIEGKDAGQYMDRQEIIDDGIADGFPELSHLSEMPDWYGKGDAACAWAIRSILRCVTNENDACLVLLDDAQLINQFFEYELLVKQAGDFDIIQLAPWLPPETSVKFYDKMKLMPTPTPCKFDIRFVHGAPFPGEHANIYSPVGAEKMLEALSLKGNVHIFPEGINEHFGHGSIWRLISLRDPNIPWVRCHNEFSYRVMQNELNEDNNN